VSDFAKEGAIELKLPPERDSVTVARHRVTALAEDVGAPVDEVALAISEAVGNAVVHAFRGGRSGTILVSARADRSELVVTVADDGVGMLPDLENSGLGLGSTLIAQFSTAAKFESSDAGTTVTMTFELASQPEVTGGN
jgi:two-component sensor histidine kinase